MDKKALANLFHMNVCAKIWFVAMSVSSLPRITNMPKWKYLIRFFKFMNWKLTTICKKKRCFIDLNANGCQNFTDIWIFQSQQICFEISLKMYICNYLKVENLKICAFIKLNGELRISKKLENETIYYMNFQQKRYFVNLSRAFLNSYNQCTEGNAM